MNESSNMPHPQGKRSEQDPGRLAWCHFDPACSGQSELIEHLRASLARARRRCGPNVAAYERSAFSCIAGIYGVSEKPADVALCRIRLYERFERTYLDVCRMRPDDRYLRAVQHVISCNIVCDGRAQGKEPSHDGAPVFHAWALERGKAVSKALYTFEDMAANAIKVG